MQQRFTQTRLLYTTRSPNIFDLDLRASRSEILGPSFRRPQSRTRSEPHSLDRRVPNRCRFIKHRLRGEAVPGTRSNGPRPVFLYRIQGFGYGTGQITGLSGYYIGLPQLAPCRSRDAPSRQASFCEQPVYHPMDHDAITATDLRASIKMFTSRRARENPVTRPNAATASARPRPRTHGRYLQAAARLEGGSGQALYRIAPAAVAGLEAQAAKRMELDGVAAA